MRLVVAECSVEYAGRLDAYLERATRVLMVKADGSVLVHADGGSYKPLNWMSAPCILTITPLKNDENVPSGEKRAPSESEALVNMPAQEDLPLELWDVTHKKTNDSLHIEIFRFLLDETVDLGEEPGLVKDGVEAHLQQLLAEHVQWLGENYSLVRREYPTAIGPVDLMLRESHGDQTAYVAVEVKRRGEIDGVEQLTRYLDLLSRDPIMTPVRGIFAAQEIKPQARTLAEDRGIECVVLDYDAMRGLDNPEDRLF